MKRAMHYSTNMVSLVASLYKEMALSALTLIPSVRSQKLEGTAATRTPAQGVFAH